MGIMAMLMKAPAAAGAGVTTNLVAYWKMDEASGSRLDSTTNAYNLTPTGAPGSTTGKVGSAAHLVRASAQYLTVASNADLSMGSGVPFHVGGWFRLTSAGISQWVMAKGVEVNFGAQRIEYGLQVQSGNSLVLWYSSGGTFGPNQTVASGLAAGTWYRADLWYDAAAATVNWSLNNGTPGSASLSGGVFGGSDDLNLGRIQGQTDYLDGDLDGWGVWRGRTLTSGERTQLYNGGAGYDPL